MVMISVPVMSARCVITAVVITSNMLNSDTNLVALPRAFIDSEISALVVRVTKPRGRKFRTPLGGRLSPEDEIGGQ